MKASTVSRTQRTRRVAFRAGMLGLALASVTACIFDKGDYQGGGRSTQGAKTAQTSTATETATSTAPTSTSTSGDSGQNGLLGDGG